MSILRGPSKYELKELVDSIIKNLREDIKYSILSVDKIDESKGIIELSEMHSFDLEDIQNNFEAETEITIDLYDQSGKIDLYIINYNLPEFSFDADYSFGVEEIIQDGKIVIEELEEMMHEFHGSTNDPLRDEVMDYLEREEDNEDEDDD